MQRNDDEDGGIPDQDSTITFILVNKERGWKVALRKMLIFIIGQECIANSCAVDREHAKMQKLDPTKLQLIKGMHVLHYVTHNMYIHRNNLSNLA